MLMDGARFVDGYERYNFRPPDEEGEVWFAGNAVFREEGDKLINALASPLVQFEKVERAASCITWENHPEWDIDLCTRL